MCCCFVTSGAKKKGNAGKMARRAKKKTGRERSGEKKKRSSLFRRLSTKRAEQSGHVAQHSPLTPSGVYRGNNSPFSKSWSFGDTSSVTLKPAIQSSPLSMTWSPETAGHSSSASSSPNSTSPNSPATQTYGRPSTLTGLKHKRAQSLKSPCRRKSVHNIPLSPLARTPSPSPMPVSPTRSPSPLAFTQGGHHPGSTTGHHLGASNQPQKTMPLHLNTGSSSMIVKRPSFSKPKGEQSGSPLLRRALSPDRLLHPNSAEKHRKASLQEHKSKSLDPT